MKFSAVKSGYVVPSVTAQDEGEIRMNNKYSYNTKHVILNKLILNLYRVGYSFECAIPFFFFLLSMALSLIFTLFYHVISLHVV